MKITAYECKCGKLYKNESDYLECVKSHNDDYYKEAYIDGYDYEERIKIEYSHTKLSEIIKHNGQIDLCIYAGDRCDSFVSLNKGKVYELIRVLEEFKTAYLIECFRRKGDIDE